jgi:hypothetical protein
MAVRIRSILLPCLLFLLLEVLLKYYLQTGNDQNITHWVAPDDKSGVRPTPFNCVKMGWLFTHHRNSSAESQLLETGFRRSLVRNILQKRADTISTFPMLALGVMIS